MGVQDKFGKSGKAEELMDYFGLTSKNICEIFVNFLKISKWMKNDRKCKKTNIFYHFFDKKVLQKYNFIGMIR